MNEILTRLNFTKAESHTLGVLVIGNEVFCKPLCKSLQEHHKTESNKYKLYLVTCSKIEEVLHHTNHLYVDYVVFLLDTRQKSCAIDVEYNLQRMHKSFLCGRTCIVNANPYIPQSETNVSMNAIIALKEKYDLPVLNGNIQDSRACLNLVQRLLKLIETNLGLKQKSPFIPWLFKIKEND